MGGERERWRVDLSCYHQHRQSRREEACRVFLFGTGGGGGGGGTSLTSPYENQQCPIALMSHDHSECLGGGDGLFANPAEREGLCQLSHDVMIYFEEVMSGLCSEAAGVYSHSGYFSLLSCTESSHLKRHFHIV